MYSWTAKLLADKISQRSRSYLHVLLNEIQLTIHFPKCLWSQDALLVCWEFKTAGRYIFKAISGKTNSFLFMRNVCKTVLKVFKCYEAEKVTSSTETFKAESACFDVFPSFKCVSFSTGWHDSSSKHVGYKYSWFSWKFKHWRYQNDLCFKCGVVCGCILVDLIKLSRLSCLI